jgi:hypothetical protein
MAHRISTASLLLACAVVAVSAAPGLAACDLAGLRANASHLKGEYLAADLEARDANRHAAVSDTPGALARSGAANAARDRAFADYQEAENAVSACMEEIVEQREAEQRLRSNPPARRPQQPYVPPPMPAAFPPSPPTTHSATVYVPDGRGGMRPTRVNLPSHINELRVPGRNGRYITVPVRPNTGGLPRPTSRPNVQPNPSGYRLSPGPQQMRQPPSQSRHVVPDRPIYDPIPPVQRSSSQPSRSTARSAYSAPTNSRSGYRAPSAGTTRTAYRTPSASTARRAYRAPAARSARSMGAASRARVSMARGGRRR